MKRDSLCTFEITKDASYEIRVFVLGVLLVTSTVDSSFLLGSQLERFEIWNLKQRTFLLYRHEEDSSPLLALFHGPSHSA